MYRDQFFVDVLFFVEHRDRELQAICQIARLLKFKYGLSVAIASVTFHSLIASIYVCPKIVVVPFALNEKDFPISIFRAMYKNKIIYVNMNLEQILHSNNIEYKRPKDDFSKYQFKQFCWGQAHKEFLLESGVEEGNIFVTGNPSTSLLINIASNNSNNLRDFISAKFNLPIKSIWHFFPMNDGWAFTSDYHIRSRIANGYNEKNAWEYKNYMVRLINIVIDWFIKIENEKEHKDFIIILRPHPSVSVEEYEKLFIKKIGYVPSYIYLSKELSAREWLIASDTCFTTFSTVALDSNCIGKPTYLLEPISFPGFLQMPWQDKLPHIKIYNDFLNSLSSSNHLPSEKIADFNNYVDIKLDGIAETARYLANFAKKGDFFKIDFYAKLKGIAKSYRQTLGSYLRFIAYRVNLFGVVKSGHKPDYFKAKDIVSLIYKTSNKDL